MPFSATRRSFLGASLASVAYAQEEMPFRTLGRTGLKVSVLGFGCMTTTDASVITQAADAGVNYFDTARGYQNGNNERMVGAALKNHRKKIVLSSKTPAKTAAAALADLDKSLTELATDHLDIWYLHARSKPEEITDDLLEAQAKARQAGKIRFAGVSTHAGQNVLVPFLLEKGVTDVILTSYNFAMAPEMDALVDRIAAANVGVVAMKVMAGGFRRLKEGDPLFPRLRKEGAMASALKWAVRRKSVHTSIPGIMDLDQLDENMRAVAKPFGPADERILAARLERIAPLYCRMCGACDGRCRQGLPVADVIRYVTYADGYGEFALGRERYRELPEELQSVKCGDCLGCTVRCPNGVRVRDRVALAQEYFA